MLPTQLIDDIRRRHSGPERGYHDWSHPQALLKLLDEVRAQLSDPLAVECAILLHDAVYDPTKQDNEAQSAALAEELLSGIVPAETLARTARMIAATERHQLPDGAPANEAQDCRIFLDMDLSILGADWAAFERYEAGVRHEYRHVSDTAFRRGRAAILERFLAREQLYMSDWGQSRFEAAARANLQRSLAALRASP